MSKKEVLIVGPNFYGYNESVAKAFQVKGFKTNIINFEEENIPVTGNKLIDKFLLKAKREYYVNEYGKKVNQEIIDFVDKNNIKNIVVIKGSYITRETLEYIKKKGYGDTLTPLLGAWDRAEDIEWDKLPDQFVLKCNHGCAYNIVVSDKKTLDKKTTEKQLNTWLKEDFGAFNIELHYSKIKI